MKSKKDNVSGIIHLVGAFLALVGLVFLVSRATLYGKGLATIVSFAIFGISVVLLYGASATYHLVKTESTLLRRIDHIMIYILIAGTYTPILVGPLNGTLGLVMLIVIWTFAVAGLFIKIFWLQAPRWLYTGIYIVMGWLVLFVIYPLVKTFIELDAFASLFWLLLGGILYTVGGVIYAIKRPKFENEYFGFHEIFHVFVVLGTLCHFYFIIQYVLYL